MTPLDTRRKQADKALLALVELTMARSGHIQVTTIPTPYGCSLRIRRHPDGTLELERIQDLKA